MKVTLYALLIALLVVACTGNRNKKAAESKTQVATEAVVITKANFDAETSKGLVLVDFWAEWCPPCRQLSPVLAELDTYYDGKMKLVKINVDDHAELAQRFQIQSIPTLLLKKEGEIVERLSGFRSLDELKAIVEPYL